MSKIAHLADIHIRLSKMHGVYRNVFEQLYKSLRENTIDIIVLVGDLFHSKNSLSPEAVDLGSEFLRKLSEIAKDPVLKRAMLGFGINTAGEADAHVFYSMGSLGPASFGVGATGFQLGSGNPRGNIFLVINIVPKKK